MEEVKGTVIRGIVTAQETGIEGKKQTTKNQVRLERRWEKKTEYVAQKRNRGRKGPR